jgi:hypothetical protein
MNISVKPYDCYKEFVLQYMGTTIDTGFLSIEEQMSLAATLLTAASELARNHFDTSADWQDFVSAQT